MSSHDLLLAAGISLCLLAVVLRGFHQSNLRATAARNQMARMDRMAGKPTEPGDAPPPPSWFAQHLPLCYRVALVAGVILAIAGLLRR